MKLEFIAVGKAQPQGSAKAVTLPGCNFTTIVSDNPRLKRWRKTVGTAAKAAMRAGNFDLIAREIPVIAQLQFCFRKPASAKNRTHPTVKPDCDKLCRAILDALTGIVWTDDSQVVRMLAVKSYGAFERVEIRVEAAG